MPAWRCTGDLIEISLDDFSLADGKSISGVWCTALKYFSAAAEKGRAAARRS